MIKQTRGALDFLIASYKAVMNETMSSKFLIIANNIFNEFVKTL